MDESSFYFRLYRKPVCSLMKVKAASVAPEESTTAEFDWQQKYGSTNTPRVTLLASSVVFELKKATIKWKRRFISIAKRKFFGVGRKRTLSATYEVFIDFNKHKKQDDVRALKCGRSIQDLSYHGQSLDEIIPAILLCQLRITFGNNVELPKWAIEVYRLYKNCRLIPVALIFGGSSCLEGVDLRCFLEKEFIAFVRLFSPHLREVQLATSRLFAFSAFPHLLLSMINLLSFFGMTYEEPSVRYSTDDITTVVHVCSFRHKSTPLNRN
uniref:FBD domain-containing protein n=1 Tax=Angiostrongylus cantonensis TaxID=6313 RepID=A0A0K0DD41_ANGCA